VVNLIESSSASEEAVAVAAAESMTSPGYVMLLSSGGESDFAARSGDVYPIRRGARQVGSLIRAAQGVSFTGVARLAFGSGSMTAELNVETATRASRTVVVATDGDVPWKRFSGGRSYYAEASSELCDECGTSFQAFANPCAACGEHICPECGRCSCAYRPVRGERPCRACFEIKPPAAFESDAAERCLDCA
jgi:hypothetical protein